MAEDFPPFRRARVALADGALSVLEAGPEEAPRLYFIHATGFNAATYRQVLAPLTEDYRVLAPDMRGHGLSELPADPDALRNWEPFARDVRAHLAQLEGRVAVMAGHSMGAIVSLLVAGAEPARVGALVLADPVLLPPAFYALAGLPGRGHWRRRVNPMSRQAARRRADWPDRAAMLAAYRGRGAFRSWPEEMIADYIAGGTRDTETGVELSCAPAWEAATFAAQAHRPWRAARAFGGPVHILAAERFSTFRPVAEFVAARRHRHWRVERLAGTSHFLPMEEPEALRAALIAAAMPVEDARAAPLA